MTYRSRWELLYFNFLDNDSSVLEFFSESLRIKYISNERSKKERTYIPDLFIKYVNGESILVEIKPSSKIFQKINLKKFKAAEDWCRQSLVKFLIITEKELKGLGLL